MATGLETEAGLAIGRGNAASLRRNSAIIPGFGNDEASAGTKDAGGGDARTA